MNRFSATHYEEGGKTEERRRPKQPYRPHTDIDFRESFFCFSQIKVSCVSERSNVMGLMGGLAFQ